MEMIISKTIFKLGVPRLMPQLMPLLSAGRMNPDFFIVGFQKSGTTTLYDSIMEHPRVIPGIMKENNMLAEKANRIGEFRLCFPYQRSNKITGDASHLHTWMPYGLERIKKYYPMAKILVIMRNPVDRAFSHFNMDQKIGYLPKTLTFSQLIDIEMALRAELSTESTIEETYEKLRLYGNRYGWPLSRGLYHLYIEGIQSLGMSYLPLFMEDLERDYKETMNRVYDFIGLEAFDLKPMRSNKGKYANQISDEDRKRLEEFYESPNQILSKILELDLPW